MGKTGKWLKSFLTGGKKDKDKERDKDTSGFSSPLPLETRSAPLSVPTPREKKRWSFRRSTGAGKESSPEIPAPAASAPGGYGFSENDMDQKRHAVAVAVATAAAADAAMAAAHAAAAVVRLTSTGNGSRMSANEDAAATKIQSAFRSYLARKALHALKGLVKLQALVRGHLVRKQATATLRCMQALVTVQARARAQRIRMLEEAQTVSPMQQQHPANRRSPQHPRSRQYEMERSMEDNVKIVEMDLGESRGSSKSRSSYSMTQSERTEQRQSAYNGSRAHPISADPYQQLSPVPSALTDMSPRACSGHFEEFSFTTAQSSPHYFSATSAPDGAKGSYIVSNDYAFFPSYMANTESSRAKARSQSAPKLRPESCERPPSRRRPSVEGRNIPRSSRMQRSSSHVGASGNGCQFPWPIKLDRSNVSLKDSECGSTSTILTNNNYCRSLISFEVHGHR